jgi:hypothetical protein
MKKGYVHSDAQAHMFGTWIKMKNIPNGIILKKKAIILETNYSIGPFIKIKPVHKPQKDEDDEL